MATKPKQTQATQPGREHLMYPQPQAVKDGYKGSSKLKDRVVIVTGGDSGIGRAICVLMAREGAKLAVSYLNEEKDAQKTKRLIEEEGSECLLIKGDVSETSQCQKIVDQTLTHFQQINCVVNNAAIQFPQSSLLDIDDQQLEKTFKTNIFPYFYLTRSALPHLKKGSTIINTTSVTAYRGSKHLIDYSATKGAIVSFTRSLALSLADKQIRVNGVAPGPVWTPLIPASFDAEKVEQFGADVPLSRPGEPAEIAPCYVFLASSDSSFMTGQILHPNGGEIING